MGVCSWFEGASVCGEAIEYYDKENREQLREYGVASKLSNKWDLDFGGDSEDEIEDETLQQCEGDVRLRKIQWLLDAILQYMGWSRTESQIRFHNAYIRAALPKIYGADWDRHSARVLAKFGVRQIKQLVLGMTPRRWGKTIAVSSFCAVMLLSVAGIHISTFSTGKRASGLLMDSMTRMLNGVEGAEARTVKSNSESLSIAETQRTEGVGMKSDASHRLANKTTTSVFHSYPSSVDGQINMHTRTHSLSRARSLDRQTGRQTDPRSSSETQKVTIQNTHTATPLSLSLSLDMTQYTMLSCGFGNYLALEPIVNIISEDVKRGDGSWAYTVHVHHTGEKTPNPLRFSFDHANNREKFCETLWRGIRTMNDTKRAAKKPSEDEGDSKLKKSG